MVRTRWFPVAVIAVIICLVLAVFTGAAKKDSISTRAPWAACCCRLSAALPHAGCRRGGHVQ